MRYRLILKEDLGNTPKGYKDINHIIDNCNEWFENNGNKSESKIWAQHVQIRNWAKELKKYRSQKGPITFERKIKDLNLKKKPTDKDGHITLDTAILSMYSNWKKNKFDMEDRNRELMYCLIELKAYRKKFKKQDFSCKI